VKRGEGGEEGRRKRRVEWGGGERGAGNRGGDGTTGGEGGDEFVRTRLTPRTWGW